MDAAALLAALGAASLPSVSLEIYRTFKLRTRESREDSEAQRRAPMVDAQFVVTAAREATEMQNSVLDRMLARIVAQEDEIKRLQLENDRLWHQIHDVGGAAAPSG